MLLTGFDDTDLAGISWPPLTSVRQPLEAMGKMGAELVLAKKGGGFRSTGEGEAPAVAGPGSRLLKAELIVRRSSCRALMPPR